MIRNATRRLTPAVILTALMLAAPHSASAANFGPIGPFPACSGFGVTVSGTQGDQRVKVTREKNGLITTKAGGNGFILTLTGNGNSITVPTNGSNTTTTTFPDKSRRDVLTGQNVVLFFAADDAGGPKTPVTILYTGRVVINTDANGVSTVESASGKQVNLCDQLAG